MGLGRYPEISDEFDLRLTIDGVQAYFVDECEKDLPSLGTGLGARLP
tara:strand:+ start:113 stop:253 length:141 start_codon:yes stop_codon:yes gene_type:complete